MITIKLIKYIETPTPFIFSISKLSHEVILLSLHRWMIIDHWIICWLSELFLCGFAMLIWFKNIFFDFIILTRVCSWCVIRTLGCWAVIPVDVLSWLGNALSFEIQVLGYTMIGDGCCTCFSWRMFILDYYIDNLLTGKA